MPVADVAVVVVELFVPNLEAEVAAALREDARTDVETVLVAPPAVEIA